MSADQPDRDPKSFEETLRAIAAEVSKSAERFTNISDLERLARASGIDAEPLKQFADDAGKWLREQVNAATGSAPDTSSPAADSSDPRTGASAPAPAPRDAGQPHPLDRPTEEQGRALAALDSGRWTVEPGTVVIATTLGRGEGPENAHALGQALHVRDWVDQDGDLTFAGGYALSRWLEESEADLDEDSVGDVD